MLINNRADLKVGPYELILPFPCGKRIGIKIVPEVILDQEECTRLNRRTRLPLACDYGYA